MIASDFRSVTKGALRGFFTLTFTSGLVLHGCSLLERDGRRWIGLPSAPQITRDGKVKTDSGGKPLYNKIVEFNSKAAYDKFQQSALPAVLKLIGEEPAPPR